MVDLSTEYLGLKLANPIVPSASPFTRDIDSAKKLEDAGAAAVVMHSLFEEKIDYEEKQMARFLCEQDLGCAEADHLHPVPDNYTSYQEDYLNQLQRLKASLDIPLIASLNGISSTGWIRYGKELEKAGADALELNVYYVAVNEYESARQVEMRYISLLNELRQEVRLPITMKLSSHFSSIADMASLLQVAGANGLVLFNRFYQPDIDLETLEVIPKLELSSSQESLLRIRWIATLFGRVNLSLAVTGGFHNSNDMLKALLAGADVTHMCSALLTHGPEYIRQCIDELRQWMEVHEYESVKQLKGSLSYKNAIDPAAYERANYVSVLDSFSSSPGMQR